MDYHYVSDEYNEETCRGERPMPPENLKTRLPDVSAILDNLSSGMVVIGYDCRIRYLNPVAQEIFLLPEETLIGVSFCALLEPESAKMLQSCLAGFISVTPSIQTDPDFFELQLTGFDHSVISLECSFQKLNLSDLKGVVLSIRDVTAHRKAENNSRLLSSAMEQIADSVFITDQQGVIEYVNQGFVDTTGYTAMEVLGHTPGFLKSGHHGKKFYLDLWTNVRSGNVFRDVLVNRRKDGVLYYEEKTITPLRNIQGDITHFVSTGKDITEQIKTQRRLQYLAQHDVLTDLPNRCLLIDRLEQAITASRRTNNNIALLFMDVDRFKKINDTLGHKAGDALLKNIAVRLKRSLRQGDTVAHLSGDEFAILIPEVNSEQEINTVASTILDVMRSPFAIQGRELFFSASIGIAKYPESGYDAGVLVKHAEIAMYQAKYLGGNCSQFYDCEMNYRADERLLLENDLRHALERSEFCLYYQPQIRNSDHRITGVEALIRWQHPKKGLTLPSDFIPLLEECGLIVDVGEWVIETACQQLKKWQEGGMNIPQVSVNVSPRQLDNKNFLKIIKKVLDQTGLSSGSLELEITENYLVRNEKQAIGLLNELRELGVGLAMDDFGTGYSSLRYLRELPVQTLKIDRDFVKNVPVSEDDCSLASAIVSMGHSLHLNVIAEGVENSDQLGFMENEGCDITQGFFYSHPLAVDDMFGFQEGLSAR